MLPKKESLTIEFKSDRNRFPDSELIEAVVAFANTEGGDLYIGIEDDGEVTGVCPAHENITSVAALVAHCEKFFFAQVLFGLFNLGGLALVNQVRLLGGNLRHLVHAHFGGGSKACAAADGYNGSCCNQSIEVDSEHFTHSLRLFMLPTLLNIYRSF